MARVDRVVALASKNAIVETTRAVAAAAVDGIAISISETGVDQFAAAGASNNLIGFKIGRGGVDFTGYNVAKSARISHEIHIAVGRKVVSA